MTQTAKKICDVIVMNTMYQYMWHKVQAFSRNFYIKDVPLIDQSPKKSMKSWKKWSKTGTLAVMTSVRN